MLDDIIAYKRKQLREIDTVTEIGKIENLSAYFMPIKSLKNSIVSNPGVSIIAEIKRKSPSKGLLNGNIDVPQLTSLYERAGAIGISVLTEDKFFGGGVDDLINVKAVSSLPVLRKDFIIDEFQIWQSRAIGADAILLIVSILTPAELMQFKHLANSLDLDVLIEVHNEDEIERALKVAPEIIGVNNRNLATFDVDLSMFERLRRYIPDEITCVAESGIHTRDDILYVQSCGADVALIGESLVTSGDPLKKIYELRGIAQ